MKILCSKFHQNRPINEEFDFLRREGGPLSYISISIIIGEHMKILCFKFHKNRSINEEFDFWGGKFFLWVPRGAEWPDYKKSKSPYTERWSQPTAKISSF